METTGSLRETDCTIAGAVSSGKCDPRAIMNEFALRGYDVQPFRADRVYGREHLASAFQHAVRSMRNGRNRSERLLTEALLFASFDRQISRAIEKMGIGECSSIALLITPPIDSLELDQLLTQIGLRRDDTVIEVDSNKLESLREERIVYDTKDATLAVLQKIAFAYMEA